METYQHRLEQEVLQKVDILNTEGWEKYAAERLKK